MSATFKSDVRDDFTLKLARPCSFSDAFADDSYMCSMNVDRLRAGPELSHGLRFGIAELCIRSAKTSGSRSDRSERARADLVQWF